MAANATARVTVKLLDQLTAPAQIVRNSLRGIRGDMAALSGARLGITKQIEAATARARELRSTLMGLGATSLVAGYGLKRVMKPGTDFETTMTDIRQKADMSASAVRELGDQIKTLAPTVNKSAGEVAKGVDFLMGMSNKMTPAVVMSIMPAIGKAATAYRAEIEDLSKATYAAMDNMKVPADRVKRMLDVMAQAGKEGGFELKDMAREFPSLTASAEALGMKGTAGVAKLTAALQIARKGAADGSEAATNTANLMQKIISPETTKKFTKAGIDIRKELKKTQKEGGDPFVMIAEQIKKATKGDLSKLGDFFEDAQVQKFLRPLIANLDEYKKIRDTAESAANVVEADYKIRMETFQSVIDRTSQAFEKLAVAVGESLIPILTAIADKLAPIVTGLAEWVSANSQLASGAIAAAGALLVLAGLGTALRLLGVVASLAGLKGLLRVLNYLAPKGAPKSPVASPKPSLPATPAGTGAAPKTGAPAVKPTGSVPATAAPGSATTASAPRIMSAAEIAKAAKGMAEGSGAGALSKMANSIKGGIIGGAVQFFGEMAIDKLFDALPKPAMPEGYDPKAEMKLSFLDRLRRLIGADNVDPTKPTSEVQPIDAGMLERSRRVQDERRRDPEGARGRAMQQRDAVTAPEITVPDGRATGVEAGTQVGQGVKDGIAAQQGQIAAAADAIMAMLKTKLGAGIDVPIRPKVEGAGAALRGIHADAGIN